MERKNCLLVLPRSIFPVIGGYAIKNKELIKILNERYNLSLVVISDHIPGEEEEEFYSNHSVIHKVFVFGRLRYLLNAFHTLFTSEPLQVGYFYFNEVQSYIDSILSRQDIVIGALIRAMKYLDRSEKAVKVFDMVDSIAINYQKSKDNVDSFFWKLIYGIETSRLFRSEEALVKDSDVTFLFNWKETEHWKRYGNVHLVPHGVNERLFTYETQDEKYSDGVAFIGKMDYQPNVDAVLWYLRNVHSKIGNKIPFYIVGASPAKEVINEAAKYPNVIVTGFVDDPFVIIKSSFATVAPMQTGAGIQNKVLESMGLGKAVVTTTLAATPIFGAKDGIHLKIADTPEDFIKTLLRFNEDRSIPEKIGESARKFIMDHYTWRAYGEKYCGEIDALIKNTNK